VRYHRGGQRSIEIEHIIAANSRTPELVLGDIRGQVGAGRLGEQRVRELIAKFGKTNSLACFARLLELAELKMRKRDRRMGRRPLRSGTLRRR
jgi:N-methylhydantoinase B